MVDSLKSALITCKSMTEEQADTEIRTAREDLMRRLEDGDMPFDICEEYWGLEPDYLLDLVM